MIELLMLLFIPGEINPQQLTVKYLLKEKFVDYQSCQEYVEENLYFREDKKDVGIFYKIDTKEYQVMLTYCKPVKEDE
jgi:hypothetical protein